MMTQGSSARLSRYLKRGLLYTVGCALVLLCGFLATPVGTLFDPPYSTVLLDREGMLLGAHVASDGQWRFPPTDTIPHRVAICLIEFEDRQFRSHFGIRPSSLARAFLQNRKAGKVVSGGSTLTMQLARLAGNSPPRTYVRKAYEMLLALRIELHWNKDRILAAYLSHAPFGGNVVGIDAAAWRYFGRPAAQLGWAECATLAVLPNAPSAVHPGKGRETLLRKRDKLLDRLLEAGHLDSLQWSLALLEPLPERTRPNPQRAPHLLTTLMATGHTGTVVRSTLSGSLQDRCTSILTRYAYQLNANEVHNAAVLIADTRTGKVLAYVGNLPDAGQGHAGDVDVIPAGRSTGSLLKPFLFADMLDDGELLPTMLVADIPTYFAGFAPRNYDEHFSGAVPANRALARSLNVPAVRELRDHGVGRTLRTFREMGLDRLNGSAGYYGLSLIVGGGESSLWELTGAYASLSRTAQAAPDPEGGNPRTILPLQVLVLETDDRMASTAPFGAGAAFLTLKALESLDRPESEAGWQHFSSSGNISWKTGTSYGHRDAWAIGTTPRFTVGVWTGNADGEGRPGLTGSLAAAPLLFELFALLPYSAALDPPYDDLLRLPICTASGHPPNSVLCTVDSMLVPMRTAQNPPCPYHRSVLLSADGRTRTTPGPGTKDTTWFVLPPAWERYVVGRDPTYHPLPAWNDPQVAVQASNPMALIYPDDMARIFLPTTLDGGRSEMVLEAAHGDLNARIFWHLDEHHIGTTQNDHRLTVAPSDGEHLLTLTDEQGRQLVRTFNVTSGKRPH